MDRCYLCGNEFNSNDVRKHDEHIIQQAIGGSLTEKDILCSSCGTELGETIDAPFTQMFRDISTRLDIKRDRKNNKRHAVKGKFVSDFDQFGINIGQIDVLWRNFEVTPLQPFHKYTEDKKNVIIYGNKKASKSYRKKVEREISEKFSSDCKPKIIICNDIEGLVSYPLELDNKKLKKGLAKIAIGFASKHGIARTDLPLALNLNEEKAVIIDKPSVIQFYPLGVNGQFF